MPSPIKSFGDLGKATGRPSIESLSERLVSFVQVYMLENEGTTPDVDTMCNHLMVPEDVLHRTLARLETSGRIHIIARRPLRIMFPNPQDTGHFSPPEDPHRFDRFLNVEAKRHALARFIGSFETNHDRGPTLREMMEFTGVPIAGYVARMCEILAKKNIIQFGQGLPTKLTVQGRQFYGFSRAPEERPTLVIVNNNNPPTTTKETNMGSVHNNFQSPRGQARIEQFAKILARYKWLQPGFTPIHNDLAKEMGYSDPTTISRILKYMVQQGWVEHKPKHRAIEFTDAGRQRFASIFGAAASEAPPPTEPQTTDWDIWGSEEVVDTRTSEDVSPPPASPKEVTLADAIAIVKAAGGTVTF